MFIAFGLEAVGILALWQFGHDPVLFVVLTGLVFFAWGEIYSLFPSTCADTFGTQFAAANAGCCTRRRARRRCWCRSRACSRRPPVAGMRLHRRCGDERGRGADGVVRPAAHAARAFREARIASGGSDSRRLTGARQQRQRSVRAGVLAGGRRRRRVRGHDDGVSASVERHADERAGAAR